MPAVQWSRMRSLPKPKRGTENGYLIVRYLTPDHTYDKTKPARKFPLWVDEMRTSFALSGSTAQSVAKRDFYPRNFNQPSYQFHGQTFNETHYGKLGEFIRRAQKDCVLRNGIMQIFLPAHGATHVWVGPDGREHKEQIVHNQRGRRPAIWLEGYVNNIQRAHAVGVQAPEYEFAFIVSRTIDGPIKEQRVSPNVLPRNWDSFIHRDGTGFITNPSDILSGSADDKGTRKPPTRVQGDNPATDKGGSPVDIGSLVNDVSELF